MSSELRAFIVNLFRVCALSIVLTSVLFFGIRPDLDNYFAGSLQQIKLLEQIKGPRIILVGGSNVAFGLDAELMQKQLDRPVINFGLHAGLGIVPLRELQQYIHQGDIIVISLEYSMFSSTDAMNGDPAFLSDWVEVAPSRTSYLSHPIVDTPTIYGIMLQRKINRSLEYLLHSGSLDETRAIFNSRNFDANGDFIGHLDKPSLVRNKIPFDPFPVQPLQDDIFIFLNDYSQMARAQGVTLYFEATASRQVNCDATGFGNLTNFFNTLDARLSMPILTHMDQVCMPDKYFFDTPYHLNAEGRRIKTQRLIENLLKQIGSGN